MSQEMTARPAFVIAGRFLTIIFIAPILLTSYRAIVERDWKLLGPASALSILAIQFWLALNRASARNRQSETLTTDRPSDTPKHRH